MHWLTRPVAMVLFALAIALRPGHAEAGWASPETLLPATPATGRNGSAIASNGDTILAAWREPSGISVARLSRAGAVIDSPPRVIVSMPVGPAMALAFGGGVYLLAWSSTRFLYALVLDRDGAPISPEPIVLDATATGWPAHPSVAYDGHAFLVGWHRHDGNYSFMGQVLAARVASDGSVLDVPPLALTTTTTSNFTPSVASSGDGWMIAWNQLSPYYGPIRIARLTAGGSVLDPGGVVIVTATDHDQRGFPALGSDGVNYFLSYGVISFDPAVSLEQFALVLDPSGTPMSPPVSLGTEILPPTTGSVDDPTPSNVTFDGSHVVIDWWSISPAGGLFVTWLDRTGVPVEVPATAVPIAFEWSGVSATMSAPGEVALAYWQRAGGLAFARFVRLQGPLGAHCGGAGQCESGYCSDGVCCNESCASGAGTDCRACSAAMGGGIDGTCTTVTTPIVCRAATGPCDVGERCDGTSGECPADLGAPDGTACDGGVCALGSCVPPILDAGEPVDAALDVRAVVDVEATVDAEHADVAGADAPGVDGHRDGAIGFDAPGDDGGGRPVARGCGCAVPGGSRREGARAIGGALLLAALFVRRSRRSHR